MQLAINLFVLCPVQYNTCIRKLFSVKGLIVNTFGSVDPMVSLATTWFCSYSWKTTIDNKQTHRQDCVPITFIYKSEICNSVLAWIWPADSSFPTTGGTENPGLWELHAICLKHISFILVMFYGIYLSILIGYIQLFILFIFPLEYNIQRQGLASLIYCQILVL